MIAGPIIAEIAALLGDSARATMTSALLDGRALSASELARVARITPQTASTHLAKLTEAGLLSALRSGRHRYFRLASPAVAEMIDGIVAVALAKRPRFRPFTHQARALGAARICYDHLAGRLGVALTDALVARRYVTVDDDDARLTAEGTRFLTGFGVELPPFPEPAATRADSAWTGPSAVSISRGRWGPRSPTASSPSAGWSGSRAATRWWSLRRDGGASRRPSGSTPRIRATTGRASRAGTLRSPSKWGRPRRM